MRAIGIAAILFGVLTILSGGQALFGGEAARAAVGAAVPFVLWFNSDWLPQRIALPEQDWVRTGEVVLSTDFKLPVGTQVKAGDRLSIGRRTVVVFREL